MRFHSLIALAFCTPFAWSQGALETFSNGNTDDWGFDQSTNAVVRPTGGNPGAYLEVPSVAASGGLPLSPWLRPCRLGNPFVGDYVARRVVRVSFDVRHVSGTSATGIPLYVLIASDWDTPSDLSDDCAAIADTGVRIQNPDPTTWTSVSVDVPIDADLTQFPPGWGVHSYGVGCGFSALSGFIWALMEADYLGMSLGDPWETLHGTYALDFDNMRIDLEPLGTSYCGPAVPNSTGGPASIRASGSSRAGVNSFSLTADGLPPNSFGYFLNSPMQGFSQQPGGSQGNLCLDGTVGRHATQVMSSGPSGSIWIPVDLTALPRPAGPHPVMPGETWNFQAWYRDANPGVTSNFTDGTSVMFQ